MKKLIQFFILTIFPVALLTGCFFGGGLPFNRDSTLIIGASKKGPEKTSQSRNNLRGVCEDDSDCIDICEEIYGEFSDDDEENDGRIDRCLELSYQTVVSFDDIAEVLEDHPAYSQLRNLDPNNFADFLDVSLKPWIEFVEDMRRKDSENLLRWIASERNVANGIESAYLNREGFNLYIGVYRLLSDLKPDLSECAEYEGDLDEERRKRECAEFCLAAYDEDVGGSESFVDIIDEVGNGAAEDILDTLAREECPSSQNTDTAEDLCRDHRYYFEALNGQSCPPAN